LSEKVLRNSVFLSFNYDLILERAIFDNPTPGHHSNWDPITGYGYYASQYVSTKDLSVRNSIKYAPHKGFISRIMNKKKLSYPILKPHGSLAWFYDSEHHVCPLLNDAGKDITLPSGAEIAETVAQLNKEQSRIKIEGPVLIPPTKIKRYYGEHAFPVLKLISKAFECCRNIIVIGWNIPETDTDVRDRILRSMDNREIQRGVEKLIICDVKDTESFYDKFSMYFTPKTRYITIRDGFTADNARHIGQCLN